MLLIGLACVLPFIVCSCTSPAVPVEIVGTLQGGVGAGGGPHHFRFVGIAGSVEVIRASSVMNVVHTGAMVIFV